MSPKNAILRRVVIYPKDIQKIMGCADRTARHQHQMLRKKLGKKKHQFLTIVEFCKATGLSEELVNSYIVD